MIKFDGAVVREQGVTFAIAAVQRAVLDSPRRRQEVQDEATRLFDGLPTVLMAQTSQGRARYFGRDDLVRFLARVPLDAIPWRTYTVS